MSNFPHLDALPSKRYGNNVAWPKGTRQPYSKAIADHFCSLVATNETSLVELLRRHPELPPFNQIDGWRTRKPGFAQAWKNASRQRADFLAEKCADLAASADPKTAHVVRVKFDIYKWLCAKLNPDLYGDKPIQAQQTTVNVGVSISPERLSELRAKLDSTRSALSSDQRYNRKVLSCSPLNQSASTLKTNNKKQIQSQSPASIMPVNH